MPGLSIKKLGYCSQSWSQKSRHHIALRASPDAIVASRCARCRGECITSETFSWFYYFSFQAKRLPGQKSHRPWNLITGCARARPARWSDTWLWLSLKGTHRAIHKVLRVLAHPTATEIYSSECLWVGV
eukprot:6176117-Pleurochrysis_carterae.AAC.4